MLIVNRSNDGRIYYCDWCLIGKHTAVFFFKITCGQIHSLRQSNKVWQRQKLNISNGNCANGFIYFPLKNLNKDLSLVSMWDCENLRVQQWAHHWMRQAAFLLHLKPTLYYSNRKQFILFQFLSFVHYIPLKIVCHTQHQVFAHIKCHN